MNMTILRQATLCVALSAMLLGREVMANDVIFRDDFSSGELTSPSLSDGGHMWLPKSGDVGIETFTTNEHPSEITGLVFSDKTNNQIFIDLKNPVRGELIVRVSLMQVTVGMANPTFGIGIQNKTTGAEYFEDFSPSPEYFSTDSQKSGFHTYDKTGDILPGSDGVAFPIDGQAHTIELIFNPLDGLRVTLDGQVVAEWANFRQIEEIDRIMLRNGKGLRWCVRDIEIEAANVSK
jgi:hypothetical protein